MLQGLQEQIFQCLACLFSIMEDFSRTWQSGHLKLNSTTSQ